MLLVALKDLSLSVDHPKPTVAMMKSTIKDHLHKNPALKKNIIDKCRTPGIPLSQFGYENVVVKIWEHKDNPRDWAPTETQMLNLYGRVVLCGIVFSVAPILPTIESLTNFGYKIETQTQTLAMNLDTGTTHRSPNQMLRTANSKSTATAKETNKKRRHE